MERKIFTPSPGRLVRAPDGRAVPKEGRLVQPTDYWLRRAADGDGVLKAPPKRAAASKKED